MNDANSSPRSTSRIHEAFISKVEFAIISAIKQLARRFEAQNDHDPSTALRKISAGRSPRIRIPSSMYADRDRSLDTFQTPDASFFHEESLCDCPGVVVEVSSRWEKKDLRRLAGNWIEGSGGAVSAVLGFNIDPGHREAKDNEDEDEALFHGKARADKLDKTATLTLWRADYGGLFDPSCEVDTHVEFRDSSGAGRPGLLELHLEDLLGADARERVGDDALAQRVVLPYKSLSRLLDEAEGKSVMQRSVAEWRRSKRRKVAVSG